jgi:hypothetical protein
LKRLIGKLRLKLQANFLTLIWKSYIHCFCSIPAYRQDKAKGVEILVSDLKVFSTFNEELYKEITQLLTLNNFR